MYRYAIKLNGYTIGQAVGRFQAFKRINMLLGGKIGLWFGEKCIVKDTNEFYTMEKTNE